MLNQPDFLSGVAAGQSNEGSDLPQAPVPVVTVRGGKMVTDSRNVAAVFEKRHDNVLQAIRYLECSSGFRLLNFQERE